MPKRKEDKTRPWVGPKTQVIHVRVTPKEHELIVDAAQNEGINISAFMLRLWRQAAGLLD